MSTGDRAQTTPAKWAVTEFRRGPVSAGNARYYHYGASGGGASENAKQADDSDEDDLIRYVTRDQIIKRIAKIERQLDLACFLGFIYVSHSQAYRSQDVVRTATHLAKIGYYVIDYRDSINDSQDIELCDIFLMFYHEKYEPSLRCCLETQHALRFKKRMVIVTMDKVPARNWPIPGAKLDLGDIAVNFPNNRQFDDFLNELVMTVKEKTPNRTQQEDQDGPENANNGIIATFKRRKNRDKKKFKPVDVPFFAKYYTRREDELHLLGRLTELCQKPETGTLIIGGDPGVGKTAIMARLFTNKANFTTLMQECNVQIALWLNCYEWRDDGEKANFNLPAVQKSFVSKVLEVAKKADPLIPSFLSLTELFLYLQERDRRPILILDNVSNTKLVQFIRNNTKLMPCCVIARDQGVFSSMPLDVFRAKEVVRHFTEEQMMEMFQTTYEINCLTEQKLAKLAGRCLGSPLIASLIAARFTDPDDCDQFFQQILSETSFLATGGDVPLSLLPDTILRIVRQLFETSLQQMDESQRISFNAFLFYEPEEPISSEDTSFLWGLEGEETKTKARALCRLFAKKSFIMQIDRDVGEQDDRYLMHQIIHDVALQHAKRALKATDPAMIRLRLVTGSARVAEEDEKNDEEEGESGKPVVKKVVPVIKAPDIDVLCEAVIKQRLTFLTKVFEKISASDLAVICGQTSPKICVGGQNFLHSLYRTKWESDYQAGAANNNNPAPDNDLARCLPNNSYELIDRFLNRVSAAKINFIDIFRKIDSEHRCLLWDLFDDEEVAAHQKDRLRLICRLSKWRGDYLLDQIKMKKIKEPDFDAKLLEAIVKGDVEHAASAQKVDALGETALMVAARLGRTSIAEVLAQKNWEKISQQNKAGETAISIASYYGHLGVIQGLFKVNKPATISCLKMCDQAGRTPLMIAARNGHLDVVQFYCDKEPSVIAQQDRQGYTALMHAAVNGHIQIVMALQTRDISCVKLASLDGQTPMMQAARFGQLEIVQFLVEKYPQAVTMRDKGGLTALLLAASSGNYDIVHYLYEKDANALKMLDERGRSALMLAARGGHIDTLEFLYDRDVEGIKKVDADGWGPLMFASQNGSLECTQFLFSRYPEAVEEKNKQSETPMMTAAANGHLELVQYLYAKFPEAASARNRDGFSALMLAAENGHLDVIDFLHSKNGEMIKKPNKEGRLALTIATIRGDLEVINNLYAKWSEAIKAKDDRGLTAVHHAVQLEYLEIIKYIHQQFGDSIKLRDNDGTTPLMLAASLGFLEIARFLVEKYPEALKLQDNNGMTALMHAAVSGHLIMVQFLYEKYPESVSQRDGEGRTPAALAALNDRLSVLAFLGERYPLSLRLQDNEGFSPAMHATVQGHLGVVRFLCERVTDTPQVMNNDRQPPLFIAAASGHIDIVRFLFQKWPPAGTIQDVNHDTALKLAKANGHTEVVNYLLDVIVVDEAQQ